MIKRKCPICPDEDLAITADDIRSTKVPLYPRENSIEKWWPVNYIIISYTQCKRCKTKITLNSEQYK